jgi:hypothetical protein
MCQQQLFWVLLVMADSPNRHNVAFQILLDCLQLKQQCSEADSSSRSEAPPLHQQLVQLLRASLHDEYVFQETCVAAIIAAVLNLPPDKQPGGIVFKLCCITDACWYMLVVLVGFQASICSGLTAMTSVLGFRWHIILHSS